ncbi:polysaccharide pyruvyl transferase family protein [Anaerocolumna aminovalerica]|uniref:polysaccharide pyruvyl transferase family protein n=1 Tax=Anaerocolumna aminovalerica TaxID=1527 RepID=UPI00248AD2CB|nr:polysaccharide pyruvyl transferase family protein [Anaerocolumna aminovalerica]
MKVGIVPLLYDEYNYGGILQFYALQRVLRDNGIECNIIFFDNEEKVCDTSVKKQDMFVLTLKKTIYKLLNKKKKDKLERIMQPRKRKIDLFKESYYSSVVDSKEVLFTEYDAIICGSDQIWNPAWARRRSFLEFVPDEINKVIYGASLGCESMTNTQKAIFKPRIERLQHVSVREYSAKKLLDSFVENVNIKVVLDPTLLLMPNEWGKIVKSNKFNDYIFTYFLGEYSDKKKYIQNIADKNDLKIVNIPCASGERLDENIFGDIQVKDADPAEFIGLIKGAEYVFTDSFHACVFSVLFQRQFFVFQRDGNSKMYGRISTLLKNFQLPDRNIEIGKNIDEIPKINYIYNEVNQKQLREQSLKYLFGSIRNENS